MNSTTTAIALAALVATAGASAADTTWNVSVWGKERAFTSGMHELARLVEKRTNGKFKFNISYGGLSNAAENIDGISIGAFEMAQVCPFNHPEKLPTLTVMDLPFLGISSIRQEGAFEMRMLQQPDIRADLMRWNAVPVMPAPQSQYNLAGNGEPIDSIDDFAGKRIRANGVMAKAFGKLGAVPTPVTATEVYSAMESGVVDAVAFADASHLAYDLAAVSKWWTTNLNPGAGTCPFVANADAVKALSKEQREIFFAAVPEAMEHYYSEYEADLAKWQAKIDEAGLKRVTLPDKDVAKIREIARSTHQEWIEQQAATGRNGQAIYDAMVAAVKATSQ